MYSLEEHDEESRGALQLSSLHQQGDREAKRDVPDQVEGIPLDVFHDLRKKSVAKRQMHYPFASHDHSLPGHHSGRSYEDGSGVSVQHMERVRKIADLLSHLSSTSKTKDVLEELCLERKDFEDVLYELEAQGRRDVALCALHFRPSFAHENMSQSFCSDFMNVLIRKKCPTHHLVQFKQIFESCQWTASLPLLHHLAQLCIAENELDLAVNFVKSSGSGISDTALFNRFIEASISAKKVDQAFRLFEEMQKRSVAPDVYTFAALMTSCFRRYDSQMMFDLFSKMKEEKIKPDLYIYNLCIRSCEQLNDLETALVLYEEMKETDKIVPNTKTYSILIQLCGRNGRLSKVLEILEELKASGQKPSTLTMNGLLQACIKAGEPQRAFSLFQEMRDGDGVRPDGHSYAVLFHACAVVKDLPKTLTMLRQMKRSGLRIDEVAYTAAIDVCASCGDAQTAILLLHEMVTDGVQPNLVTRNVLIRACIRTAMEPSSFALFAEVKRCGFKLDVKTYNSIMDACSSYGDMTNALKWKAQMVEDGIDADSETYALLIKAASRCMDFSAAARFLRELEECRIPTSIHPYNAFFIACHRCHEPHEAQRVFQQLQSKALDASSVVRPSIATYNIMIQTLLDAGKLDGARALFAEIEQRGLKPDNWTRWLIDRSSL